MMLKIVLADDEVFVRKGLIELIPWEEMKFTIVGEANNGKEALEMIMELKPDLVITDIRMPLVNGLDLIRSVKEHGQLDPFFIIISGYNDFNYAQQALRYGVHDYIMKPIDEEEMTAALRRLTYSIIEKKKALLSGDKQQGNSILEALMQGALSKKEAESYSAMLGMPEGASMMYVLVDVYAAPQEQLTDIKMFQEALHAIEYREGDIPVIELQPGKFGLLLNVDGLHTREGGIEQALERLRVALSHRLSCDIGMYVGNAVDHIAELRHSYLEASEAARHKYAERGVIWYSKIKALSLYVFDISPDLSNRLVLQLEEGSREAYRQTAADMFRLFREQRFTPQAVTGSLSRCITGIIAVIKEMDGSEEEVRRLKELAEREHGNWSLQLLEEHFMLALMEAEDYIALLRQEWSKGSIKQIKNYIDAHYSENISLKSIAAMFYMNALYLGRLFRKSYGVYFNEYLLELRVKEAKKLLRQTDLRMYEIAARVGFQNADYFVAQFEKREKLSPTEYRNILNAKELGG
ncbi:response regulator [Paenibacillus sp. KS-LC4]|uniref:response regulator n=1 Tax=Paenibacillus sp. KS-LC4 TaxID=2979727 RepID=UPI0030CB9F60